MVESRDIYRKGLHYVSKFAVDGKSIFHQDWDVMIILDACRYDLMKKVADEYEFIQNVNKMSSVDTMTPIWMEKTFTDEVRSSTQDLYYLCANPASDEQLSSDQFSQLDEIWRYEWDDEIGNVSAESVTRRAITVGREQRPEKLLIHYNQPHWPFIPAMETSSGQGIQMSQFGEHQDHRVWERLKDGEISKQEVWKGYKNNLRYVLDNVAVLLENLDAEKVIISSDHGNALGEWGIYGHPMHMPIPCIRNVPWIETTASDAKSMMEHLEYAERKPTEDVEEKLRDLGYY